jgi:hypothetical protein
MRHDDQIILAYAVSDTFSNFAAPRAPTLHVVRQSACRLICALGETGRRQDTVRVRKSWDQRRGPGRTVEERSTQSLDSEILSLS